jgi:hypothetical protein
MSSHSDTVSRFRWIDMSSHSDTVSWFRANHSLFLHFNTECLVEKQQKPISQSLVWLEASRLTITQHITITEIYLKIPNIQNKTLQYYFSFLVTKVNDPFPHRVLFFRYFSERMWHFIQMVQKLKIISVFNTMYNIRAKLKCCKNKHSV